MNLIVLTPLWYNLILLMGYRLHGLNRYRILGKDGSDIVKMLSHTSIVCRGLLGEVKVGISLHVVRHNLSVHDLLYHVC